MDVRSADGEKTRWSVDSRMSRGEKRLLRACPSISWKEVRSSSSLRARRFRSGRLPAPPRGVTDAREGSACTGAGAVLGCRAAAAPPPRCGGGGGGAPSPPPPEPLYQLVQGIFVL